MPFRAPLCLLLAAFLVSLQARASVPALKAIRFDHGEPIVISNGSTCLVLEFERKEKEDVFKQSEDTFQVRAPYRLKYHDVSQPNHSHVTSGEMLEYYHFQTKLRPNGKKVRELKDLGSHENLDAGDISLAWSNGGHGTASWLYFPKAASIDFIQQISTVSFEELNLEVIGSLTDKPNIFRLTMGNANHIAYGHITKGAYSKQSDARVTGMIQQGSIVGLEFEGLVPGVRYQVQRSSTVGQGKWKSAGHFVAENPEQVWYPSHNGSAALQFFRLVNQNSEVGR